MGDEQRGKQPNRWRRTNTKPFHQTHPTFGRLEPEAEQPQRLGDELVRRVPGGWWNGYGGKRNKRGWNWGNNHQPEEPTTEQMVQNALQQLMVEQNAAAGSVSQVADLPSQVFLPRRLHMLPPRKGTLGQHPVRS